jgi:hypothetical protein
MIVKPNREQHPAIQKLKLTVVKLEELTNEAMSSWFNDKENRANAKKKPFLKEIFAVAKLEARYLDGELGKANEAKLRHAAVILC